MACIHPFDHGECQPVTGAAARRGSEQPDDAVADGGRRRLRTAEGGEVLLDRQPSRQFATVAQLGGCVGFLCSPAADQITGTTLSVDGGWTAL